MSEFSIQLRQTRAARGMTRKQIADHLGITVRAYQYYEEGKREPSFDRLVALAAYLNVSTDFLLGAEKGEPYVK